MLRIVVVLILFFITYQMQAQGISLKGALQDQETKLSVRGVTAVLKKVSDTTFSLNAITDTSGRFLFANLPKDSFTLRFTSIGYESIVRMVKTDSADVDLGIVILPKTAKELSGVTVTSSVALAVQKGDTIQFNASQFKVNPDASAEDLTRKIPGITVENGQVKAQGENVRRVTVDGRELFGDDATAALRNLPAEIVDKIQVFDRLSDQAQATGFDDGNTSKEINIVTKANMRNGQFGRVYASYGTDNRYSIGGNTTFLKNNRRVSLVGISNNINQQNFSTQDLLGVTSNTQRSDRGNRGGGGGRGGDGNRGGGSGGNRGGGNFGGSNNFLVGQQNGINRTNAFGINYSDVWKTKVTVSGSYFFNNVNNTTGEVSNTQYFQENFLDNTQRTGADSRNSNHRFNLRMEYRIDSSNQIIITPNLSFQDNSSDRTVHTTSYRSPTKFVRETNNTTNSHRQGNNLSNNILYRHSFPKRGRTFSIDLNTSYNKRDGETYVKTFERQYIGITTDDTTTQRLTDQFNDGHQVSTNIAYTEPVGKASQLQFNYNPSFSGSSSDQKAFGLNPADDKYSTFLDSLSNKFKNNTDAHNAGVSYRYGNRDKQLSFGVNYQQTALHSDQVFPRTLTVDKTFRNFLPNAMIRYRFSPKTSVRIFYRASTNQPSITQLQNVVDPTRTPFFTAGNPELEQQYTHILSTQYTYTNAAKGLLLVGNVFLQSAKDYVATATYAPIKDSLIEGGILLHSGDQLTKPINLDDYVSLRSFLTFAVPIKFIKSNLNLNTGFAYNQLPGLINYIQNQTKNYTYTLGSVISSNISQYVDFTVSYSANFNQVRSNSKTQTDVDYFNHTASVQLNILSKNGWVFQTDANNQLYSGLTESFNQNYFLWNMSVGKKLLKDKKGDLRLSVFDLLKQNRSIVRNVTEAYIEDVRNEVLRQYFMLTFTYNLRNFGAAAARSINRSRDNRDDMRF